MSTHDIPIGSHEQAPSLPKQVFVTGANGFIGRALAKRYRDLGVHVRGVDITADVEWNVVAGNIAETGAWQAHARGSDLVINTAAVVSNMAPRELYWRVSVNGVRKALDAAVAAGAMRFVQISSCAAFGKRFPPNVEETYPVAAATGRNYDDAKGGGEHPALAAHAAGEIACTVVRPGDVYGPGSRPWVLIPLAAIASGTFLLPAHGKGILSPIYIDDLVDGIVRLMASGLEDAVNIGRPEYVSVDGLVGMIASAAGKTIRMKHIPGPVGVHARGFTNDRIRSTGWESKFSLRDGIGRTYPWIEAQVKAARAEK